MLRRIDDMPAGTIGFEAIGEVGDEDWMRPAPAALSFLLPGRAKAFRNSEPATAETSLVAG